MKQKRFLSMFALLLMAATGAMAQTETLLTTITPTGYESYDETTPGVVTVTHDNNDFSADYGWLWDSQSGSLTVEAKEGYTITRCVFKQNSKTPVTITTSPFKITFGDDGTCEQCGEFMDGVTSIEVYGYAPAPAASTYSVTLAEGTEDGDNWTISPAEAAEGDKVTVTYSGEKKVKSVKAVKKEADPLTVPMTIEAITAGSISVSNPKAGMQYSLDGGATKTAVTTDEIVLNPGDKVQFYGNGTSITSYGGTTALDCTYINGIGDGFTFKVYGNIMSLVDEENFATAKTLSAIYTFRNLFNGNTALTDASGLLLPATTLAANCYELMFMGCTALTAAPALPATQLAEACYYNMFYQCTALTAAPELPATQLATNCYYSMFANCSALTTAPELPATQLASSCYYYMFRNCTSLTTAPALPATQLAESCYRSMFSGCTALTAAPELPATQLATNCYYGMFANCSALTTAPALPATQLAAYCYMQMFANCTALTTAPVLPAETLVLRCYQQMFSNCQKLATVTCLATSGINLDHSIEKWLQNAGTQAQGAKFVYTVSSAEWPTGNNGIPSGWTRVNVDN